MTTIRTRQLQQYTRPTKIHTRNLKIQHVQKVNKTKVRKYCIHYLLQWTFIRHLWVRWGTLGSIKRGEFL